MNRANLFNVEIERNDRLLEASNSNTWEEFELRNFAEQAELEYVPVGHAKFHSKGEVLPANVPLAQQPLVVWPTLWKKTSVPTIGPSVTTLALAYDGTMFVTGNVSGQIQFWDSSAIEVPARWLEATPRPHFFGQEPIRSIDISRSKEFVAVCNQKRCSVISSKTLEPLLNMNAPAGEYTVVRFAGNDLVAIGTDNGLVDVWRVSNNERIARFHAGDGAVTGIVANSEKNSVYVSTSQGSLVGFDVPRQPTTIVPHRNLKVSGLAQIPCPEPQQ